MAAPFTKLRMETIKIKQRRKKRREKRVMLRGTKAIQVGHYICLPGCEYVNPSMVLYDTVKKTWTNETVSGFGPAHLKNSFLYEDKLMVFEEGHRSGDPLSRVYGAVHMTVYDLVTKEWKLSLRPSGEIPVANFGFTGDFIEELGKYVVFGGTDGRASINSLRVLEPSSLSWTKPVQKGRAPVTRENHNSCVHDGVVYYHGGVEHSLGFEPLSSLAVMHLTSKNVATWSQPKLLLGHSALLLSFHGVLLCFGMAHSVEALSAAVVDMDEPDKTKRIHLQKDFDWHGLDALRKRSAVILDTQNSILFFRSFMGKPLCVRTTVVD